MLTTPVWLSFGFPLPVAIASNQLNGAAWTLLAARNYLKGRSVDWKLVGLMVLCGLAGAYGGTLLVRGADPSGLKRVIGLIILGLAVLVAVNPALGQKETPPSLSRGLTALLALPLGVYEAFFGSGNGLFTSLVLTKTRGLPLMNALGCYYVLAFFWNSFAVCIYSAAGLGNASLMIPSTLGSVLGAYLGSRIGRKQGHRIVRPMFILLGGVLGLKLALGW
ncbi:UPF0721 transmembrane protein [Geomonas limicola]|uniref:Probable membrane transporter protein n=2 Tax=Geomonas limicola TaxID=2740186 RepID=A0A6V8N5Z9_9BACT|nr:UPF0721 transmembrane protein [Geomonas limicola]